MTRSRCIAALLAVTMVFVSGCSFLNDSTQSVLIKTDNPAASIFIDGRYLGKGSVETDLKRRYGHTIVVKAGGKVVAEDFIGTCISGAGVFDVLGGFLFLVPWLGILAPGFWELDPAVLEIKCDPD